MRRAGLASVLVSCVIAFSGAPAAAESPLADRDAWAPSTLAAGVVLPIRFVSQLGEPAPVWWRGPETPYCVAAASAMVIDALGLALPAAPLATLFDLGHAANVTSDPGIDPAGALVVLERFGWGARVEQMPDRTAALGLLVAGIDRGAPVIALTKGGTHAVVVYGYERDPHGGIARIHAADPLSGWVGPIGVSTWLRDRQWWGEPFRAAGALWQGRYVTIQPRAVLLHWDPEGPRPF